MKTEIYCTIQEKTYSVKKVVDKNKFLEIPRSADYFADAYTSDGYVYGIYRTPDGVLYAKVSAKPIQKIVTI